MAKNNSLFSQIQEEDERYEKDSSMGQIKSSQKSDRRAPGAPGEDESDIYVKLHRLLDARVEKISEKIFMKMY